MTLSHRKARDYQKISKRTYTGKTWKCNKTLFCKKETSTKRLTSLRFLNLDSNLSRQAELDSRATCNKYIVLDFYQFLFLFSVALEDLGLVK